jgi:cytochrome c551/c552
MTTATYITRMATGAAAILTAATAIIPTALAGGEPKNQSPFTHPAAGRGLVAKVGPSYAAVALVIAGESKNQAPFTLRVSHPGGTLLIVGEPKNQLPFAHR